MLILQRIIATVICISTLAASARAAETRVDSVTTACAVGGEKFRPTQLILPGALIALGAAGVAWDDFKTFSKKINDGMSRWHGYHKMSFDDYVQYVPAAAYLGLGAIPGVPCRHNFKERFLAEATAYVTMAVLTQAIKFGVHEKRPDSDLHNSFPSGHTAKVFTAAELIRQSYPVGVAVGAYTVACSVAFMRLYNNRHWLNDVIAGAGIGILSARVGMWMLPLYRKWFHMPLESTRVMALMPYYDNSRRGAGMCFSMIF